MIIYIRRSDAAYVRFEGMTESQITEMLDTQGLSAEFIDEETFKAATEVTQ